MSAEVFDSAIFCYIIPLASGLLGRGKLSQDTVRRCPTYRRVGEANWILLRSGENRAYPPHQKEGRAYGRTNHLRWSGRQAIAYSQIAGVGVRSGTSLQGTCQAGHQAHHQNNNRLKWTTTLAPRTNAAALPSIFHACARLCINSLA